MLGPFFRRVGCSLLKLVQQGFFYFLYASYPIYLLYKFFCQDIHFSSKQSTTLSSCSSTTSSISSINNVSSGRRHRFHRPTNIHHYFLHQKVLHCGSPLPPQYSSVPSVSSRRSIASSGKSNS